MHIRLSYGGCYRTKYHVSPLSVAVPLFFYFLFFLPSHFSGCLQHLQHITCSRVKVLSKYGRQVSADTLVQSAGRKLQVIGNVSQHRRWRLRADVRELCNFLCVLILCKCECCACLFSLSICLFVRLCWCPGGRSMSAAYFSAASLSFHHSAACKLPFVGHARCF